MYKLRINLAVRAVQPEPEESVLDIQIEIVFTFFLQRCYAQSQQGLNPSTALMAGIAFVVQFTHVESSLHNKCRNEGGF